MKPTEKDINQAISTVRALFDLGFKDALSFHEKKRDWGINYELGWYPWAADHEEDLEELDVELFKGETKAVIIDWNLNGWVIKIALNRASNPRLPETNYCEVEAENFAHAVEAGVDEFFAATYEVGELDGFKIFLQAAATIDEGETEEALYEFSSRAVSEWATESDAEDEAYSYMDEMDDEDRILALMGEETPESLMTFLSTYEINDLHSGNFGIINNHWVIIDFSGYRG